MTEVGRTRPSCFCIMPMTASEDRLPLYGRSGSTHFQKVEEVLFRPAVEEAGFDFLSPQMTGSSMILGEIVRHLETASMVLCDTSQLNANVFFELGVRTALNRPVTLVVDDLSVSHVPFDLGGVHYHTYDSSLDAWLLPKERSALAAHLGSAYQEDRRDRNELWKHFGLVKPGSDSPAPSNPQERLERTMEELLAVLSAERHARVHESGMDSPGPAAWLRAAWPPKPEEAKLGPRNASLARIFHSRGALV